MFTRQSWCAVGGPGAALHSQQEKEISTANASLQPLMIEIFKVRSPFRLINRRDCEGYEPLSQDIEAEEFVKLFAIRRRKQTCG